MEDAAGFEILAEPDCPELETELEMLDEVVKTEDDMELDRLDVVDWPGLLVEPDMIEVPELVCPEVA